ncbi:glycoside hydrolase family 3 protein [Ktedonospora formicarum]|uniref:Glycoside hydrolase family 3 n=1 Tax=Ktedonospora formicarum TaxID=2778364 RepID=A0A8J3HXH4_9CHLR|nr:glycoside hydrolase family 3 N-terminal domain-containing protein [Ktedonospora formicarum]GHO42713.1 glycoside hydrolase family 3 [Ktedonospora formicarum]
MIKQSQPTAYPIHRTVLQRSFFSICCLILLLTGCANIPQQQVSTPTPTPTRQTTTKGDENTAEDLALSQRLAKAKSILQQMSLEEKLGQLIMVEYMGATYEGSELSYMVSKQHVGGYLYQSVNGNFDPPSNTIDTAKQIPISANQDAKIPLLIAIDQEGGEVNKLATFYGETPSASTLGASDDPETVFKAGTQTAEHMKQLGINTDLAPVVDVATATPPLLSMRTFGTNAQTVSTYAGQFLDGLQKNNIIGTLKHFPGLGSLTSNDDPHNTLPIVNRSRQDLDKIDLAPYKQIIENEHPAMIMSTDVVTTAIDPDLPAELSPKAINGVLRKELGYNGVVITDGLYMQGITAKWSIPEAAVMAIVAGNDMIEGPYDSTQVEGVIEALQKAVQSGELTQQRVDEAVERILLMKLQYGIIKA